MRSVGQLPLILFFVNGMTPTESDAAAASEITGARVVFRNALMVDPDGAEALEECDGVAGAVPERYQNAFGSEPGEASGIGALRAVHEDEPGVTEGQALNLDSKSTNDPIEEERRRAHRGLSVNDANSRANWPDPINVRTVADDRGANAQGAVSTTAWGLPSGIAGAAQVPVGGPAALVSPPPAPAGRETAETAPKRGRRGKSADAS
jgi:hypothetical protein